MLSAALKNFHDGVFVISANGFEERQENARRELGPDNFQFIFGINRDATSKEELIANGMYDEARAIELDRSSKPMSLGHICCSIGHANVYRHIVENEIQLALILEDDLTVLPVDEATISNILAKVPEDAELIYWGWKGETKAPFHAPLKKWIYKMQHDLGLLTYTHTMIDNLYPREFNEHFMTAGKTFFTHAYSLTYKSAETLLRINSPVALNADNALMQGVLSGEIRAYVSKQQLFGQRSHLDAAAMPSLTQR